MIYIVHGENIPKSRTLILNQQKKLDVAKRIELDTSECSAIMLKEIAFAPDLFGNFPFVVLNISKTKKNEEGTYIETLEKAPKEATLIIYAESKLSNTNAFLKHADKNKIKVLYNALEPEGKIFSFIESLLQKNRLRTYKELQLLLKEQMDPFYIFSMIIYSIRNVAYAAYESSALNMMQPFVKSKNKKYAESFGTFGVQNIYKAMYQIDKQVKQGEIPADMFITLAIEKVLNS